MNLFLKVEEETLDDNTDKRTKRGESSINHTFVKEFVCVESEVARAPRFFAASVHIVRLESRMIFTLETWSVNKIFIFDTTEEMKIVNSLKDKEINKEFPRISR